MSTVFTPITSALIDASKILLGRGELDLDYIKPTG